MKRCPAPMINGSERNWSVVVWLALLPGLPLAADESGSKETIEIDSVIVTLIEQVEIPAQEAGVLAQLAVQEGQLVAAGDLLAQIDDRVAQLNHERAEIEFENARKQSENTIGIRFAEKSLAVAEAEVKRATDSLARYPKSISATEIDRLALAAEKAALAVEQARFDHDLAQFARRLRAADLELSAHVVQRRRIISPVAGMVVEVYRRGGEWLEPSESVVRIVRMDRLRVEGFLNSEDARRELTGCAVTLRTVLPGGEAAEYAGQLVFVNPEISPINGQMRVWAEVDNPELLLRPGLRGTMVVAVGEKVRRGKSEKPE